MLKEDSCWRYGLECQNVVWITFVGRVRSQGKMMNGRRVVAIEIVFWFPFIRVTVEYKDISAVKSRGRRSTSQISLASLYLCWASVKIVRIQYGVKSAVQYAKMGFVKEFRTTSFNGHSETTSSKQGELQLTWTVYWLDLITRAIDRNESNNNVQEKPHEAFEK